MSIIINSSNPYEQDTPLCTLPADALSNIWYRLDIQGILACVRTCKQWNQRLVDNSDDTPLSWKGIFTHHFPNESHQRIANFQQAYKDAYAYPQNLLHGIYASSQMLPLPSLQQPTSLAIADGMVIIGSKDGKIEIKHLVTHEIMSTLPTTQNQQITSFAFADGILFVGYYNGSIEIWNLNTHELIKTLDASSRASYSLACANGMLMRPQGNGFIGVWEIVEPYELKTMIMQPNEGSYSLAVTNGRLLAGSVKGEIKIFDLETFTLIETLKSGLSWVTSLTVDGEKLFAGGHQGQIEIWDLTTSKCIANLTLDQNTIIRSLGFFDGTLFVCSAAAFFSPFSDITKIDFKADRANILEAIASELDLENDDPNIAGYAKDRLSRMLKLKQYERLDEICRSCSSASELARAIRNHLYLS